MAEAPSKAEARQPATLEVQVPVETVQVGEYGMQVSITPATGVDPAPAIPRPVKQEYGVPVSLNPSEEPRATLTTPSNARSASPVTLGQTTPRSSTSQQVLPTIPQVTPAPARNSVSEFTDIQHLSEDDTGEVRIGIQLATPLQQTVVNPEDQPFPEHRHHGANNPSNAFAQSSAEQLEDLIQQAVKEVQTSFKLANTTAETENVRTRAKMNRFTRFLYDARNKMKLHAARRRDPIPLWRVSLKTIDGRYGSSVATVFMFFRWIFLVNFYVFIIWFAFICLPFIVSKGMGTINSAAISWLTVAGVGFEQTWFFYGGYPQHVGNYYFDIGYDFVLIATFLFTLAAILMRIRQLFQAGGDHIALVRKDHKLPFSTIVFNAWDFTLTDADAATTLRHGLNQILRETLAEESLKNRERRRYTRCQIFVKWFLRAIALLLSIGVLAGSIVIITVLVFQKDQLSNATPLGQLLLPIIVSITNAIVPSAITFISLLERWSSERLSVMLVVTRVYIIKVANIVYLLFQYYTTYSGTSCPETAVGQEFWRLVVTDLAVNAVVTVLSNFALYLFNKKRGLKDPRLEYKVAMSLIDIIYRQALVWIGMIWVPVLPGFGFVVTFILFYIHKWVLFAVCRAPARPWDASKSRSFFYGFLLFTLVLCLAPVAYFFARARNSGDCGPHALYGQAINVFSVYVNMAPYVVTVILYWAFNSIVLIGVIILLVIIIYFLRARIAQFNGRLMDAHEELEYEKKEKIRILHHLRTHFVSGRSRYVDVVLVMQHLI